MRDLDGHWRVDRLSGVLPPMLGVWKRIRGDRGTTSVGPLPGIPFRVERSGETVHLVYEPFPILVDELRHRHSEFWLGRSTLGGWELGQFRMTRVEEVTMTQQRLRRKLIEYLQNVHAMEQNVSLMLESMIVTTKDRELADMLRQHRAETRQQERRLRERLDALGGLGLAFVSKDVSAIMAAQAKGLADLWRTDKAVRNARDGFVTEHLEIAAYELLERLAERAGDAETARLARENRAEEEAMARRIADNWDRFLELTLEEEGIRA